MQTEAPLNRLNTIKLDPLRRSDGFEANATIDTRLPNIEQSVKRQELKMNVFFLFNTLSNKNVTGLNPKTILGLDLFQSSKFNQLAFCKY